MVLSQVQGIYLSHVDTGGHRYDELSQVSIGQVDVETHR